MGVMGCEDNLEDLFLDWSSLTMMSQKWDLLGWCEAACDDDEAEVDATPDAALAGNGLRGKKLKLAARANVDNISSICLRMAGHACVLIEMVDEKPALVVAAVDVVASAVGVSFDCDVDFLCMGFMMVNTFVLEPNGPSMDMVSHEG